MQDDYYCTNIYTSIYTTWNQARRHGGALGCTPPPVVGGAPPYENPAVV